MWCLQIISHHAFEQHARNALFNLEEMTGFLGGTVIEAANVNDGGTFCMQAFFRAGRPVPDSMEGRMDNLPEGTKYVFVPSLLQKWYGFTEAQ